MYSQEAWVFVLGQTFPAYPIICECDKNLHQLLACKYEAFMKRLDRDKQSSLFARSDSDEVETFFNIDKRSSTQPDPEKASSSKMKRLAQPTRVEPHKELHSNMILGWICGLYYIPFLVLYLGSSWGLRWDSTQSKCSKSCQQILDVARFRGCTVFFQIHSIQS